MLCCFGSDSLSFKIVNPLAKLPTYVVPYGDTGQLLRTFGPHGRWINALTLSADGKRLATAANDGTVRIWDPDKGVALRTLGTPVAKEDRQAGKGLMTSLAWAARVGRAG